MQNRGLVKFFAILLLNSWCELDKSFCFKFSFSAIIASFSFVICFAVSLWLFFSVASCVLNVSIFCFNVWICWVSNFIFSEDFVVYTHPGSKLYQGHRAIQSNTWILMTFLRPDTCQGIYMHKIQAWPDKDMYPRSIIKK